MVDMSLEAVTQRLRLMGELCEQLVKSREVQPSHREEAVVGTDDERNDDGDDDDGRSRQSRRP